MDFSALSKYLPMRWRHAVAWRRERNRNIKLVEAARLGGNGAGEIERLKNELVLIGWALEDERVDHLTRKLRREADRLHVSFPSLPDEDDLDEGDEDWRNSIILGPVVTTTGVMNVRKAIREEHKAQRERFVAWAPVLTGLVTALAGLLGVIVALVVVWRGGS